MIEQPFPAKNLAAAGDGELDPVGELPSLTGNAP